MCGIAGILYQDPTRPVDPELLKDVAMHVTAKQPVAVRREDVPASVIDTEREIAKAQAAATGKPEKVVQMIIHCDKEVLDNNVVMDFLQKDDLCNIPDNTTKLMAPYSKDWTGPKATDDSRNCST